MAEERHVVGCCRWSEPRQRSRRSAVSARTARTAVPPRSVAERRRRDNRVRPVTVHTVQGGGGLRLHVREWGKADGPPILFIHGLSQNHLCWVKQYDSALADEFRLVAYDLRGHGMSEAPLEPDHYTDGQLWADDIAAIIDQLDLVQPVLVGWSYGPFVICDYVRAHGQDRALCDQLRRVVPSSSVPAAFGTLIGPGFLDNFAGMVADDLPTNIQAMRSFVRASIVQARVGRRLRDGRVFGTSSPRSGSAPTSLPASSTSTTCWARSTCRCSSRRAGPTRSCSPRWPHILATCPTAEASWYKGVGHMPHLETAEAVQPRTGRGYPPRLILGHRTPIASAKRPTGSPTPT